jgi:hypothetical protein
MTKKQRQRINRVANRSGKSERAMHENAQSILSVRPRRFHLTDQELHDRIVAGQPPPNALTLLEKAQGWLTNCRQDVNGIEEMLASAKQRLAVAERDVEAKAKIVKEEALAALR